MHRHLARVVREFQRGGNGKARAATKSTGRSTRQVQFNGKGGVA
jgi:hypothetical protein